MPADFLANDFKAIARAMRRPAASVPAVLYFWNMRTLVTSSHKNVEDAVAEAYKLAASDTGIPIRVSDFNGTTLLDTKGLTEAMVRFGEGMPIER